MYASGLIAPDEDSIRKARAAINLPYNSTTEVKRVTGADVRPAWIGFSQFTTRPLKSVCAPGQGGAVPEN
jgi:hypothetical protein